jgi:hypothetical protein
MDPFDFWFAVNNTEIIKPPARLLETFGTTQVNYCLVSELMDDATRVRVREGRIEAARPTILTPQNMGDAQLEGFGEGESRRYIEWLRENAKDLHILQYGFKVSKLSSNEFTITDSLANVLSRVAVEQGRLDDPSSAILSGVDSPWEVCLLKLLVEVVEKSAPKNIADFKGRNLLPLGPADIREQVESAFLAASRDPSLIGALAQMLRSRGIFEQNQDRFFALVRAAQQRGQIPG